MYKLLLPLLVLALAACQTTSNTADTANAGGSPRVLESSAEDPITRASIAGAVNQPQPMPPTAERVAGLQMPNGFRLQKFAEQMGKPRMMLARGDGSVYVTTREGEVWMLKDTNGDGMADDKRKVLTKDQVHGLALRGNEELYLVTVNEIYKTNFTADGGLGEPREIVNDLPDGGQHPNRTMAFGPDGKLYVSIGSTCNACDETRDESATLVVMNPDGSGRRIYAKGLRNTIGFDWHPRTTTLYGLDHGIDWLGDNAQEEELNELTDGAHYGWPYLYEDGKVNPADEPKEGLAAWKQKNNPKGPLLTYTAHAAPLDMLFYRGGMFPADFQGDAIATMRGSWNRSEPSGYKIVRIHFDDQGRPERFEDLVTGFLINNGRNHIGRPVGLAEMPDGSLLVSDDTNGVIYRLSYGG